MNVPINKNCNSLCENIDFFLLVIYAHTQWVSNPRPHPPSHYNKKYIFLKRINGLLQAFNLRTQVTADYHMLMLKDQLDLKLIASRDACTWLPQKIQTTSQNKLFKTP